MEVENSCRMYSRVSYRRDFPIGCGNSSSSLVGISEMGVIHDYIRDFPIGFGLDSSKTEKKSPKLVSKSGFRNDWRRIVTAVRSEPNSSDEFSKRNPQVVKEKPSCRYFGERKSGEIRIGEKEKMVESKKAQKNEEKEPVLSNNGEKVSGERMKVVELLEMFRKRVHEIANSGRGIKRVDTTAYNELRDERRLNRTDLAMRVGAVPGVEVGDKFHYRVELAIVGLHKLFQAGIHGVEWKGGRIATSIVANERHSDKMSDPNSLVYVGEGGVLKRNEVGVPPDQVLEGGNRALVTSMEEKRPVRVIRGITSERHSQKILYVYDGLYEVKGCEKKKGPQGNMIFEFQMARCPGQPAVPWQACRWYKF